jgi:hypothetical protein
MNLEIDFQLIEVRADGCAAGRNCGADAPVGTIFSSLRRRDFPPSRRGDAILSPDLVFVCEVSLRLESVEMYQRQMSFVPSGCTAMLRVSGSGLESVLEFVSAALPHTLFSLCA